MDGIHLGEAAAGVLHGEHERGLCEGRLLWSMIYVGTCGFAYKDWIGPFYPPRTRSEEMLPFYARQFPAVEIDMSYYGIPQTSTIASMERRTPENFRFSFKIPQTVTHPPEGAGRIHADARQFREALAPLRESGKLACVLAQFPNGFKPSDQNRDYVRRVVNAFEELPVVVEFRHRAWQTPETFDMLRDQNAGFCNVDMPAFEELPKSSSDATSSIGYVRLHGRNAKQWWSGTNVTRYQYLYSSEELDPWADRIAEIEEQVEETYVFFNNHARGNAARNAEMLEALLEEHYGEAAEKLVAHGEGGNPEQETLPGFAPPFEEG